MVRLLLALSVAFLILPSAAAQKPTDEPRVYSQAEINRLQTEISETYGIGFVAGEWIASTASEVMWFTDAMYNIQEALDTVSYYLHLYGEAPDDVTPVAFFRQHFDAADLVIDRVTRIDGGFWGNTLPIYEDGEVVQYVIQLAPQGMSSPFVVVHELGHVLDGLLDDQPQQDFIAELGGEWTPDAWIPGEGYLGNEGLFPRGVAGPNEDFADTFAGMMMGYLSPELVPVRYEFMREYLPEWLEDLIEE
jgi:hypothetical protein